MALVTTWFRPLEPLWRKNMLKLNTSTSRISTLQRSDLLRLALIYRWLTRHQQEWKANSLCRYENFQNLMILDLFDLFRYGGMYADLDTISLKPNTFLRPNIIAANGLVFIWMSESRLLFSQTNGHILCLPKFSESDTEKLKRILNLSSIACSGPFVSNAIFGFQRKSVFLHEVQ